MHMNTYHRLYLGTFIFVLLVGLCAWSPLSLAASYTVNTLADNTTDNTDCTLREAISAANNSAANDDCGAASAGDDTITFSVSGTIFLQSTLPNIVSVASAGKFTIDGESAITISGDSNNDTTGDVRIFVVNSGANLTLQNLTLTKGTAAKGGAISNINGTVTINNSTFSNNSATNGGAICSFSQQSVVATLTINNSTFSSNFADIGGVICTFSDPTGVQTVTISSSTFSDNSATNGGAIVNTSNGIVTIKNSIIASNASNNCFNAGTFTAQGVNFSTDNTCTGFTQKTLTEINLGPLANNGGPTQTHALLAGSQAIDAVSDCTFIGGGNVTQDQRGVSRPHDSSCDGGAFEAVSLTVTKQGAGVGTVSSTPTSSLDCGSTCTATDFGGGILVTLNAFATAGSYLSSWSNCDSILGNQCLVSMFNLNRTVTANFALDNTPPTVAVTGVVNGGQYNVGSVPAAGCNTSDSESGVATAATVQISNPPADALGQHTATCSGATDNAGNAQASPVSVNYSVVTTTTCVNILVQTSQKITFSPRTSKPASKTISMTIRNNSGADIQLLTVALDAGKFNGDYSFNGIRTLFGRREVTLPQTIAHRGKLTVKALVQKAAGTAKETLFAPFFNVTLSCGVLSASEPIALLPIEFGTLSETLTENTSVQVQVYTLNGKKFFDETVTPAQASQLKLSERLANGVYLYRLTVHGKDSSVQRSELKKLLIQR